MPLPLGNLPGPRHLEAGLTPNPPQSPPRQPEISREELVDEFIKVANKLMKIPSNNEFRINSKYSWTPYKTKWGGFKIAVDYITANYKDKFEFELESSQKKNKKNKNMPLNYDCNMLYEPSNEYETIALFVILSQKLGFKIKHIQSDFPDALLINDKNEEIEAEFEYLSSNYKQHCHPLNFNGIVICWRNDLDLKNINTISLESFIKN